MDYLENNLVKVLKRALTFIFYTKHFFVIQTYFYKYLFMFKIIKLII
jgi:hypothetical protein